LQFKCHDFDFPEWLKDNYFDVLLRSLKNYHDKIKQLLSIA